MEEHPNILVIKATRRLKRKLPQDYVPDLTVISRAYALQDFHKLSNLMQSDSL